MKIPGMNAGKLNGSFSFFYPGMGTAVHQDIPDITMKWVKKTRTLSTDKELFRFFYDFPLKKGTS